MNGRLSFHNKALWYQQLGALESKEYELVIKERKKKVTNDQYGYYFGGVLTTCFETELFSAFDKAADVHIYFEDKFLSYKTMVIIGDVKKEIVRHRSLSELSKQEMSEYIDRCIMHCRNDLQINILSPDEYHTENYNTIRK